MDNFLPHGFCLRWDPNLVTTMIVANGLIAIAYFCIPGALWYFTKKRNDLPYPWMFQLFGIFIVSCGTTHLMKIWTLYQPFYWTEALIDLWTAIVSIATAIALLPIIPRALALRSPMELEGLNSQLSSTNERLREAEGQLKRELSVQTEELNNALTEISLSDAQLKSLFDLMPQIGWTARADGFVDFFNSRWYDYTGLSPENSLGEKWDVVPHPDYLPTLLVLWKKSLEEHIPLEMEFPLRRKDGVYRWFLTRANPMFDKNGDLIRWVGINTDIDDQKHFTKLLETAVDERTAELKEANFLLTESERKLQVSNRDLQQFAYVASHDLQEPLRTVMSFCDLLTKRFRNDLEGDAQKYLDVIFNSSQRMQQMIKDLLQFAQVETTGKQFIKIDLAGPIRQALEALEVRIKETGAKIVWDENMPTVTGDPTQLSLVFQNLISNAIKFKGDQIPSIVINVEKLADYLEISVADNGIGMSMEYAGKIFVIFQRLHPRSKYDGTGIGLAICKRIVERHRGAIRVESTQGKGTKFIFTLPINAKEISTGEHEIEKNAESESFV